MGRLVLHWVCVFALGVVPLGGCVEVVVPDPGGNGGTSGEGGAGGAGGTGGNGLVELVRVRVSAMDGSEPANISSATHPGLFALDPRIEAAEITYLNPNAMDKGDEGPATFFPALTPDPPQNPAGYIELTITPAAGEPIAARQVTYTTSAKFPNNPSSLQLRSSEDSFATVLSTIQTDQERTETVPANTTLGDAPFAFRWIAGNDFGENGGGNSGFSTNDIVVEGDAPAP